jgi:predicted transcriptional regulator
VFSIFYSTFLFVPVLFIIFAPRKYNIVAMDIVEVMKTQRKKLHISQKDLAEMADVSIATVKQIEAGRGNPSLSTVESIMEVLGMEVRYEVRKTF